MNAQKHFFADFDAAALTPQFDGQTYDRERDHERLSDAMDKVHDLLADGEWHTISEVARVAGCKETAASARIRDCRKPKFQAKYGACEVESKNFGGGVWKYRMVRGAK